MKLLPVCLALFRWR